MERKVGSNLTAKAYVGAANYDGAGAGYFAVEGVKLTLGGGFDVALHLYQADVSKITGDGSTGVTEDKSFAAGGFSATTLQGAHGVIKSGADVIVTKNFDDTHSLEGEVTRVTDIGDQSTDSAMLTYSFPIFNENTSGGFSLEGVSAQGAQGVYAYFNFSSQQNLSPSKKSSGSDE